MIIFGEKNCLYGCQFLVLLICGIPSFFYRLEYLLDISSVVVERCLACLCVFSRQTMRDNVLQIFLFLFACMMNMRNFFQ